MPKVFLLLGGNLGDRFNNLEQSRNLIELSIGRILLSSSVYETEPWGFSDDHSFLNQAVEVETDLLPLAILECIKTIEEKLGRDRGKDRYMARTMDIDILFYGQLVLEMPELIIPHPEMVKRRFVLEPLAEIAPQLVHPKLEKPISQLLVDCEDVCLVKRYVP
jgi:2-amino-4-hydroxy-6-hydroxymethyldihydropteridine diphosphokinase